MYLRRLAPIALLMSAAVALAGCGGSTAPAGTSPAGTPSAAASATESPSPTPTPEARTYTRTELAGIVAGLRDSQDKRLTAIPAAELEKGIASSKEMMSSVVITPKACAAVADSNAQIPAGSTYAAGGSQSAKMRAVTAVTLVAVKDPAVLAKNLESSAKVSKECADFTIEVQGQKVTNKTVPLDVKTNADKTYSTLMVQTLPNKETISTLVVMGVTGGFSATAVATGPDVTKTSAAELTRLVNDAVSLSGARG